jgi:hypothetical protein
MGAVMVIGGHRGDGWLLCPCPTRAPHPIRAPRPVGLRAATHVPHIAAALAEVTAVSCQD